jgi:hypothetical protein
MQEEVKSSETSDELDFDKALEDKHQQRLKRLVKQFGTGG